MTNTNTFTFSVKVKGKNKNFNVLLYRIEKNFFWRRDLFLSLFNLYMRIRKSY